MQVAMLGPLEVRDDAGSPREVSGTRLRALLILLALRPAQVVPASVLIDELWGAQLPADAANALQALVSRLRRAIGEPAAIMSGPAGYRLKISRDDVDAFCFEGLAARGQSALAGSPAEAASLLGQALALWRGEPLADAAETQAGRAAIARLTELRLAATEDRVDAELRLAENSDGGQTGGGRTGARRAPQLVAGLEGLLTASPTRETLAALLMRALGLREQALLVTRQLRGADDDALDRLVGALKVREALLVLDNCEHLIGAAAALADHVLARCPGIRILATSREPLNITGEALWPVGPLPGSRAEQLFAERAAAVSPGFAATALNEAAVARICRGLDGMPLAIELAAARVRTMTPEQLADRLDQRFRLLTGGSRTALPRHQTLRAVVDWSWELLDDSERALLRRLSAFIGGATLEAVEHVCAVPLGSANWGASDDVLDLLTALTDKSLLTIRQTADGPRYGLLETIREYGRERLADAGETESMRRGHAAYFLRFAEQAAPHLFAAEQLDWLRRLDGDADNVHLAIRAAVTAGDSATAVGLVGAFGWYWWLRSMKQEGGDLAALVLRDSAAPDGTGGDQEVLARLIVAYGLAGMLVMDTTQSAQSVAWLRQAETLAPRLRPLDRSFMTHAIAELAGPLRAMVESNASLVPDTLDAAVDNHSPWVSGLARVIRGQTRLNHGRLAEQAEADFRMAAATFERLGERWGLAMAVSGLAQIEEWQGAQAAAAAHYEQAADLAEQLGTTEDETQFRLYLGRALWQLGGAARNRARTEIARARQEAERLGWPEVTSYAAYMAGNLARLDGDFAAARKEFDVALRIAESQRGGLGQVTAVTLTALGYLECAEGDLEAARAFRDRALAAALPTRDSPVIAAALTGIADLAMRDGDAGRAATLLGAAEGVRGTTNRSGDEEEDVAGAARALLSPADYSAAFQRGQTVSLATLEAALGTFLAPGA